MPIPQPSLTINTTGPFTVPLKPSSRLSAVISCGFLIPINSKIVGATFFKLPPSFNPMPGTPSMIKGTLLSKACALWGVYLPWLSRRGIPCVSNFAFCSAEPWSAVTINAPPDFFTASRTIPTAASTNSIPATMASNLSKCPKISALAKLIKIKSFFCLPSAPEIQRTASSAISRALICGSFQCSAIS